VFSTQDQVFTWTQGLSSRTLGPTGDFVGNRPVLVDDSTYFRDPSNNISFGIKLINQAQYNGIAVKTVTSTYPQVMFVNMTMPNIEMTIYPVPTKALDWHIISVNELVEPATLATVLVIPPSVQRIAMSSKRNIKRINNPDDVMSLPYSIVATRQRFNIYVGNY
jgi:hypothetical protein